MVSDSRVNDAVFAQRNKSDDKEQLPSSVPLASSVQSLSVVTGNGLAASTTSSSIVAPLVGTTMGVQPSSPRSPTRTRTRTRAGSISHESGLDFIGTSNAVKKLFSVSIDALSDPDSSSTMASKTTTKKTKKPTLLAVHNFDGTLIIDDAEDESNYEFFQSDNKNSNGNEDNYNNYYFHSTNTPNRYNSSDEQTFDAPQSPTTLLPPSSQSLALALSSTNLAHGRSEGLRGDQLPSDTISMLSNIVQSTPRDGTTTLNSSREAESLDGRQPHDPATESSSALLAPPQAPREYVRWNFKDLNMIVGHDTLVVRPPTASSSTSPKTSVGGDIAVRVEDVQFLRNVWEAFQRQQTQQPKALPSSDSNTRSYAQALLEDRKNKEESVFTDDKQKSTTGATMLSSTKTINETQRDNVVHPESTDKNDTNNGISEVPLQTCIVPFLGPLGAKIPHLESSPSSSNSTNPTQGPMGGTDHQLPGSIRQRPLADTSSPALSIVLDAYLDNLMANVPQLALCLEEKGLIQSVKMLPTEEIPSMMLHPSTLDTSHPLDSLPSRRDVNSGGPSDGGNNKSAHHHRIHRRSSGSKLEDTIFSPQIMETNASALLRFLKTNCTRNHATYLLRHEALDETASGDEAPQPNIQLYDISSISSQKQKKWIWWLATMSYRFALRLRHLESSSEASVSGPGSILSEAQKRSVRDRQRSLFQQTLDLLQDLMDMDGKAHESMVASVREHMADTYLSTSGGDSSTGDESKPNSPRKQSHSELSPSPPVVTASISATAAAVSHAGLSLSPPNASVAPSKSPQLPNSENAQAIDFSNPSNVGERHHRQPYAAVPVDALNKAQDHLIRGIKTLSNLLERDIEERRLHREAKKQKEQAALKRSRRRQRSQSFREEMDAQNRDHQEENDDERIPRLSPAMILQLFGMNFKLVNISLRLAEHHLANYYSSNAMQALRIAARRLNDAAHLLDYSGTREMGRNSWSEDDGTRTMSLQLQYIWLLEHCGHFARSFASDNLWRDRGHASGEDVISVLSEVETIFAKSREAIETAEDVGVKHESEFWKMMEMDELLKKSKGKISLHSLSGIVAPFKMKADRSEEAVETAKAVLAKEKILRRERRKVLVASCVSYSRAISAFQFTVKLADQTEQAPEKLVLLNLLRQRLGDACNETGKVLLAALRTLLIEHQGSKKNHEAQFAAEALLDSAEFWFTHGLEAFEACRDTRNLALLRCNLCQSFKLRANSGFSKNNDASSSSKHAEDCLQKAADQLLTAHEDLGHREVDDKTWDMVSEELAATFLVLGVRRRQSLLGSGNAPVIFQVMRLSPGEERSIVDPMERALKVYEQSDNAHQAAATHYQLALTYSKLWTCQLNESNTRKKLSKAFEHYSSAFTYFSTHSCGNEPTFCLLCLDLASLYAAIPGEEGIIKSLGCCLDCSATFSMEAIRRRTTLAASTTTAAKSTADWYDKMETIARSVDNRVFKLLRSLVKADPVRYKEMYREGLTAKTVRNVPPDDSVELNRNPKAAALLALHEVLLAVKKMYGVIVSKS